jgi:signal transduction histidine kinase
MLRSLPFGRTVVFLLTLSFIALIVIGGASVWLAERAKADGERAVVADDIRGKALEVYIAVREAEAGQRGFLLTDDDQYLVPYQEGKGDAPASLSELEALTEGDVVQQASIDYVRPRVQAKFFEMDETIRQARSGRKAEAVATVKTDQARNLTFIIGTELGKMIQRETAALNAAQRASSDRANLLLLANLAGVALLAILAVASVSLVGSSLSALRSAGRELKRTNEGLELAVETRTKEIRRANEEIQRFAYIVSHDLRSPLVNVMGFTSELETAGGAIRRQLDTVRERAPELLDEEAVLAAEEDLPESVSFIRASTAKMDRLIAAILKLSRDGRRVLTASPVAMTPLLEQVADSLRVVADRAGAEIVVEPLPDLVSDRLAVEQIFSNLVENAVKYLQPGRPGRVVLCGRSIGSDVAYEVQDNGRGIEPRDHARVFELFRRAGAQDQAGEGLGLAFVQTNVRRLGGTVELRSKPGEGSTFIVTFPKVLKLTQTEQAEAA